MRSIACAALHLVALAACDARTGSNASLALHTTTADGSSPARTPDTHTAVAAHGPLAPLESDEDVVDLDVPGFGGAVVSLPIGATTPRPVIVATHGSLDRPDWQCANWRRIVGDRAFVLCLRGNLIADTQNWTAPRYDHGSTNSVSDEAEAALTALRARFGAHVLDGPIAISGFSQGATIAPHLCARMRVHCRYAVVIEGSSESWDDDAIRTFARRGGRRVLFACGQLGCLGPARSTAARLERGGVRTAVVFGAGAGHNYVGNVRRAIAGAMPWLVEGDAEWSVVAESR